MNQVFSLAAVVLLAVQSASHADEVTGTDANECLSGYFENIRTLREGFAVRGAGEVVDVGENTTGPIRIDWFGVRAAAKEKRVEYRESKWAYSRSVDQHYDPKAWERFLVIGKDEIYYHFGLLSKPLSKTGMLGDTDDERETFASGFHKRTKYRAPNLAALAVLSNISLARKTDSDDRVTQLLYSVCEYVRSEKEGEKVIGTWKFRKERPIDVEIRIEFDKRQGFMPTKVSADFTGLDKNGAAKPWYVVASKWESVGTGSKKVFAPVALESTVLNLTTSANGRSRDFVARAVWASCEEINLASPEIRSGGDERSKLQALNDRMTLKLDERLQAEE